MLTLTFDAQAALADDPTAPRCATSTLAFDVPQTAPAVEPFKAWQAAAQALAVGLDAAIVDDDGQPLSGPASRPSAPSSARSTTALEARDLAAGSPAARRLFS